MPKSKVKGDPKEIRREAPGIVVTKSTPMMKKSKIAPYLLLLSFIAGIVSSVNGQAGYPVPQKTENLLFYFQRSHNRNTVIYELNKLPDGRINLNKPVVMYWIRFEEGGVRKELSFLQSRAFGIQWQLTDREKANYVLHFNSFRKREIYLLKDEKSARHKVFININGELSELTHLYIQSENNQFGIPLSVKYVEIYGISLKNGGNVSEIYKP